MDTQISDYEVLTETKIRIKSLTSCPRLTTHLMSVMESEFFSMGLSSGRRVQSRMLSSLSETKCPQTTPQPPCDLTPSETIESEYGPRCFQALYPPSAIPFMPRCRYHGCLLHRHSVIPPRSVHFSKSPTGHPN